MNPWLAWVTFFLVIAVLSLVGYHFSLRTLRVVTAFAAAASAVFITWYGLTYAAKAPGSLSDAFAQGADALSIALFRVLPGRSGWVVIVVLLLIGYRQLEAWTLNRQAPSLDTSELAGERKEKTPSQDEESVQAKKRHDLLAAELKFRLPTVDVRSPALMPGRGRFSGLASIAEAMGVASTGLAGGIISLVGTPWPGPRRLRIRIWVEDTPHRQGTDGITRVTVDLGDPRTGESIATETLAADNLHEAAFVIVGYVIRHVLARDRTAPPWSTGAAGGRDLAAILLAREVAVPPQAGYREYPQARHAQIQLLEGVFGSHLIAGVHRYELAHLYDLTGRHIDALVMHAANREMHPRFYRGRYRLAMSLEMLANPSLARSMGAAEVTGLNGALLTLHHTGLMSPVTILSTGDGIVELPKELRADLLDVAWAELHAIRRYLRLPNVLWRSFWHRDERTILKPYWRQGHRQAYRDGVCAALLLVAVRRAVLGLTPGRRATRGLRHARAAVRMATAITGDSRPFARALGLRVDRTMTRGAPPVTLSMRTHHWFRRYSTRSWQAAYNLACAYAAVTATVRDQDDTQRELRDLVGNVVTCLWFAVNNPECEMEHPSEWIANDPDFGGLHSTGEEPYAAFREFLAAQKARDYPVVPRPRADWAPERQPR